MADEAGALSLGGVMGGQESEVSETTTRVLLEAAAWDFITFLVAPESQSEWAVQTGYVPIRTDALELEPVASTYAEDPRYRVAYDQLIGSPDTPALQGPILGPQRDVRVKLANGKITECESAGEEGCILFKMADIEALMTELYFSDQATFTGRRGGR